MRDLVTIPLYLTSLLSLPNGQPFPKTKEEILRRFVQAHEQQVDHAEPLKEAVKGLQTEFLSALAVTATLAANTSIPETNARRSVAQMDDWLVKDGQLTIKLQTTDVLDALVSHHVLVRAGEPAGYSFQHQQFQEWYASKDVERAMLESVGDANALQKLKADILNATPWKELILFAMERLARSDRAPAEGLHRSDPCGLRGRSDLSGGNDFPRDRRCVGADFRDHSEPRAALAHAQKTRSRRAVYDHVGPAGIPRI